jgi:hypothetical protein
LPPFIWDVSKVVFQVWAAIIGIVCFVFTGLKFIAATSEQFNRQISPNIADAFRPVLSCHSTLAGEQPVGWMGNEALYS